MDGLMNSFEELIDDIDEFSDLPGAERPQTPPPRFEPDPEHEREGSVSLYTP